MKKIVLVILMALSLSTLAEELEVKVNGMVCSMCAQGIEKKFNSEPSVKSLKVNMDEKLVTIHTHEGQSLADETIKKLISEAGYNVTTISRK